MDQLQNEMNRLFNSYYPTRRRVAPSYPAVNVWTNDDGLVLTAEVPGVNPDDIEISVVGQTLTLNGERKRDEVDENVRYHRRERGYGKISRSIELPFLVDVDSVSATFKNGVLHISLPRAEADKPKKIAVKSA
jgi:HSP20 family protein